MQEGYRIFFFSGMAICALMIPLNLLLVKKRGPSAIALAAAFAAIGTLFWAMATNQAQFTIGVAATLVAILLLADMLLRVRYGNRGTAK